MRSTLALSLLAASESALASLAPSKNSNPILPGAYIVEFNDGQNTDDFYSSLSADGTTRMKLDYQLFNGASIQLHDLESANDTANRLASNPAVKDIYPVRLYSAPQHEVKWVGQTTDESDSAASKRATPNYNDTTYSPHVMTQVDKVRAKGYLGKGIRIAEIDTGIDYTHPALGGCFGKGCLVSFGYDLVGDAYDGSNTPMPDNDPMDCAGHGTHVAGIIAAQPNNPYGFTGAAPEVTLGAYRVLGCAGSVANDVLIAGFNMAYQDGANIITASIGGASGWSEDPWAVVVSRIVDKGVPCTIAAGNSGADGLFYASGAADGLDATAVASFDNTVSPTLLDISTYTIAKGAAQQFGWTPSDIDNWAGVKLPLYAPSLNTTIEDGGCDPYPANTPDLSGNIVLVRRGACTFVQKANNAIAKGAKYFIVYNNVEGAIDMSLTGVNPGLLGAAMVTPETGVAWINALAAKKTVTLSMVADAKAKKELINPVNTASGGGLSTFTSWGPTWEMGLKPQFGAPGGSIISTYPVALGSYAVLSGTSMATPLTAGIFALIAEVRGTFNPKTIEDVISANAQPQVFNDGTGFYDFKAPVPQQGGGLIQAYDAAFATTLLTPSGLSFNDTDYFVECRNFTLTNTGKKAITYKISSVPAVTMYTLGTNGTVYPDAFPNEPVDGTGAISFSENSVNLHPGESATIDVLAKQPAGLDAARLPLWSGWVAVNGTDGSSLSIPYQGLAGSLRHAIVLGSDGAYIANSTAAIAAAAGEDPTLPAPAANNALFVLPAQGTNITTLSNTTIVPAIEVDLALGSRLIVAHAVPLTKPAPKGTYNYMGYQVLGEIAQFPVTLATRGGNPSLWAGQFTNNKYAPAGAYKVVVHALHLQGDVNNPKDWDAAETQEFKIKYASS